MWQITNVVFKTSENKQWFFSDVRCHIARWKTMALLQQEKWHHIVTRRAIINHLVTKISNLWRPTLLVIRNKNVVIHAEFPVKILDFEPEDGCNGALEAACGRISSLKKLKTQFESKTFLILLNWYQAQVVQSWVKVIQG